MYKPESGSYKLNIDLPKTQVLVETNLHFACRDLFNMATFCNTLIIDLTGFRNKILLGNAGTFPNTSVGKGTSGDCF